MFITRPWMRIIPKWGWIFRAVFFLLSVWRHSYNYLFLFVNASMSLESKFVSNCDNRCFHDFFVLTFDQIWFNVERRHKSRAACQILARNFKSSKFEFYGKRKGYWQFRCIYILITNFYWLLHLPIIPNFNTFQTQRRSRWDEISRAVKYTQLLQQTIVCCNSCIRRQGAWLQCTQWHFYHFLAGYMSYLLSYLWHVACFYVIFHCYFCFDCTAPLFYGIHIFLLHSRDTEIV